MNIVAYLLNKILLTKEAPEKFEFTTKNSLFQRNFMRGVITRKKICTVVVKIERESQKIPKLYVKNKILQKIQKIAKKKSSNR